VALRLKLSMIRKFVVIVTAYFVFEVMIHGALPLIFSADFNFEIFDKFLFILHSVYDFFINVALLYTFRPRKWPEYFFLDVIEQV